MPRIMLLDDFMAEARVLARPGFLLSTTGVGDPAAFWHGMNPGRICISVKREGAWLNVVLDEAQGGSAHLSDQPTRSGTPLFAVPYESLPPIDAIFLLGSEAVETYLATNGWSRPDPMNANFPDRAAHEYEALWQDNCPLYNSSIAAVTGGWNLPWPDGDFLELIEAELAVWTLAEAEPWVEVLFLNGNFSVRQRGT